MQNKKVNKGKIIYDYIVEKIGIKRFSVNIIEDLGYFYMPLNTHRFKVIFVQNFFRIFYVYIYIGRSK